jgi:hypothetical protein
MTLYTCTTDINATLLYSHRSLNAYTCTPLIPPCLVQENSERAQHQHQTLAGLAGMGISIVIDNE